LQFFLKVEVQRPNRGGTIMIRDPKMLRMRYLKSWFAVDFVSVLPFDAVSLALSSNRQNIRFEEAKLLRCIKLLRAIKLVRVMRTSRVIKRWQNEVTLQFASQRLGAFLVILLLLSHWLACVWGFVGLTLGEELCRRNDPVQGELTLSHVSWVTTLYHDGKTSPDSPCEHFDVYMASLHWSVMTITSIGYGDIVPVRTEEYIVCILAMIAGGVLWAWVIGSVCSIISNRSPIEAEFEANADLLNSVMCEVDVPRVQRNQFREFLREAKSYDRMVCFVKVAERLSEGLRKHLLYHVIRDALKGVSFLQHASEECKMDIAAAVMPKFFSKGERLRSVRRCLCMLDRGTVAINGMILVPPGVFHEDFILSEPRYLKEVVTVSLTYTQVLVLTRQALDDLLPNHPELAKTVRKQAAALAFCRAVTILGRHYRRGSHEEKDALAQSLSHAFVETFKSPGHEAIPKTHRTLEQTLQDRLPRRTTGFWLSKRSVWRQDVPTP